MGQTIPPSPLYALLPLLKQIAVREPPYKWVISEQTGDFQLFDLSKDGREQQDLSAHADHDTAAALLTDYRKVCSAPPPPARPTDGTLDPAVLEKLRALGYVQ